MKSSKKSLLLAPLVMFAFSLAASHFTDNTVSYRGTLLPAQSVSGAIVASPLEEADWWTFSVMAGQTNTITVVRTSGDLTPNIQAYQGTVSPGASPLAMSVIVTSPDNGADLPSGPKPTATITFVATFSGMATLQVSRWLFDYGSYSVSLSQQGVPDLIASSLAWNKTVGGIDFAYSAVSGPLSMASAAKLFWANGTTIANILSSTPIFTQTIPIGFNGNSAPIRVPGTLLRNAPNGTTHLLLVIDRDNLVAESNEANNVIALADARVDFSASANQSVLGEYSRSIIKDAMRFAGQSQAIVTSTARTTAEQARVMFEVLEGPVTPTMLAKGHSTTIAYSYALYNTNGDQVIDTYVASKAAAKSPTLIKADMQQKIDDIKLTRPTAFTHTSDPAKLQVADIAPSSISNDMLFQQATAASTDPRIARRFSPFTTPVDNAFHLEIPQPAGQAGSPQLQAAVALTMSSLPPSKAMRPQDFALLSPATALSFTNRSARGSGTVSLGHQVFSFQAAPGDILSAGVDVLEYFPGSGATNDDSVVLLFDADGHLLASNDDTDSFESEFESLLGGYTITNSGTFFLVVTTFGNNPVMSGAGTITGWEDDGGSSIQFDLVVTLFPSRLGMRHVGNSLAAVEWVESGILQESSNSLTNWVDLPLVTPPHIVNTVDYRFYRLRKP